MSNQAQRDINEAFEARIAELEAQLKASQQQTVNTIAAQIQHLFSNQVMIDTIAHRFFIAAANALAHKATQSKERAPELVVLEGYIPGALRAILNVDGSITIDQQLKGAQNAGGSWESATEEYQKQGILDTFAQLLAAAGAEAGRVYYITDTVTQQAHRELLSKQLAAGVTAVDGVDTAQVMDYLVTYHIPTSPEEGEQQVFIPASAQVAIVRNGEDSTGRAGYLRVDDTFSYTPAGSEGVGYGGVVVSVQAASADTPTDDTPPSDHGDYVVTTRAQALGSDTPSENLTQTLRGNTKVDQALADGSIVPTTVGELMVGDVIIAYHDVAQIKEEVIEIKPAVLGDTGE